MKKEFKVENRPFLDSMNYIDDKILAEVLAEVKVPNTPADEVKPRRAWRQIAVYVACMVLLGALIPTVTWMVGRISSGITPGAVPTEATRVIRNGYQVYGDTVYSNTTGWFERYTPSTGDYVRLSDQESGTDGDPYKCVKAISGIVDGKLYYIYSWTWGLYPDLRAAYIDLESGEAIEFCDMKNDRLTGYPYVCGDYYYYSVNGGIYRISLADGKEDFFLDLGDDESLFMAADGEIITVFKHSFNTTSGTKTRYVINAYDIETKAKRELWSDIDLSYSKIDTSAYLDGKLYFLAYNQISNSNDILLIDVSSGDFQCVKSEVSSYWWLTDNGIYYFPFEVREVNRHDPLSSILNALFQTNASGTLRFCNLDGKNDRTVYTNTDIAINHLYDPIIACGKLCARFCGDFPAFGLESTGILADIDLDGGSMRRLNDPIDLALWDATTNTETTEPKEDEEIYSPIPEEELSFIEHVGEVPEKFKQLVENDTFAGLREIGDKLYYTNVKDGYNYIIFVDEWGRETAIKTVKSQGLRDLFVDSNGDYLATYNTGTNACILVKFNKSGKIYFSTYCKAPVDSSIEYMIEVDGGYVFVGGISVKSALVNLTVSDIVISRISSEGVIEAYKIFGDNDYDTIRHVEKTQNGVSVYFNMSHREINHSTTSALQRYDFDFKCNLKSTTEITEDDIPKTKSPYFSIDGKAYYSYTDFFKDFDRDSITSCNVIEYDDTVILFYVRFTSDWRWSTHGYLSTIGPNFFYREHVYEGYTKDGKLLWRTSLDATDYEMLKRFKPE